MGAPIRSNIFQIGSQEQRYFDQFPIQVAVLFSPADTEFVSAFREAFLDLDRLTGDDVVFFSVLDPPQDWLEVAKDRPWWRNYRMRFSPMGFSYEDRPLVMEIARQFLVPWHEMPALVVSSNLWMAEFFVTPTSQWHLEGQFAVLRDLVREWGQPDIGQMMHRLEERFATETRYQAPSDEARYRLSNTYGVLDTFDVATRRLDVRSYHRYVERELEPLQRGRNALDRLRRSSGREIDDYEPSRSRLFDSVATDMAGRLVPSATVAMRAFEQLQTYRDVPLVELLDDESKVMIETSLLVGDFLEKRLRGDIPGFAPLRFDDRRPYRQDSARELLDFTPGAQGTWKSLELETNLSLVQAARASRGIEMPAYFTLLDDNFPEARSLVHTRNRKLSLNSPDPQHRKRHRFLMLGETWHVIDTMLSDANEKLGDEIWRRLAHALPSQVMSTLKTVYEIRNSASHTKPLTQQDYESVILATLRPEVLRPLVQLKSSLLEPKSSNDAVGP